MNFETLSQLLNWIESTLNRILTPLSSVELLYTWINLKIDAFCNIDTIIKLN